MRALNYMGLCFVFLSIFSAHAAQNKTPAVSPSRETAKEVVRSRSFAKKRNLLTYLEELPAEFASDLGSLKANQSILDSGAGGLYFVEDLVTLNTLPKNSLSAQKIKSIIPLLKKPASQRPLVTAVTLNLEREVGNFDGRLRVLFDRFFTEIPVEELGQFDLITDLRGVMAYAPNADEVLHRYVQILKPGGKLYIYMGENDKAGFGFRSYVKVNKQKKLTLSEWIESIPGLRVTRLQSSPQDHITLKIQVDELEKVQIPEIALLGIDPTPVGPPTRVYWQKVAKK